MTYTAGSLIEAADYNTFAAGSGNNINNYDNSSLASLLFTMINRNNSMR